MGQIILFPSEGRLTKDFSTEKPMASVGSEPAILG
jgi:hypothetical protein